MEVIYPYVHIIHTLLAIAFLGYIFADLAVISALKGRFSKETQQEINKLLGVRTFKIFPLSLLLLVLTGGMMMSQYINSQLGLWETPLQKILLFKISLVSIIVLGVLYNLFTKFTGRTKIKFMQNDFHKLVLILGVFIVISAKMMFVAS
jgi:hypothetical protein